MKTLMEAASQRARLFSLARIEVKDGPFLKAGGGLDAVALGLGYQRFYSRPQKEKNAHFKLKFPPADSQV
ncbi:hypothetical protein AVEN_107168-1 [Araneus ventricosus]|uniref:Uncharacterized protein n=1 Tax=Araneus ventricosus TaxID=182803 RepID=A0A4Y2FEV8_ARAVE|nr:hypothetical protein AVEN_107168-1 [Araneus ventricosus]